MKPTFEPRVLLPRLPLTAEQLERRRRLASAVCPYSPFTASVLMQHVENIARTLEATR